MKTYRLGHACDSAGNPLFRAVTPSDESRRTLTIWYLSHQKGRLHAKAAFGGANFAWDEADRRPISDFPVTPDPLGVWSVRATALLGEFFTRNGDLHPILFEGQPNRYQLFDCWQRVEARPNAGFRMFAGEPLKSITVKPEIVLPDIFLVSLSIGLMVSEGFKLAAESVGLTGLTYSEVEVLRA